MKWNKEELKQKQQDVQLFAEEIRNTAPCTGTGSKQTTPFSYIAPIVQTF